jgi:high affinity Mn2+ porin
VQRAFLRQTIDLGGESGKVDADINQFAQSLTSNRLVLTVGKFAVVDKYANSPRSDFLNWSSVNVGSFDYARDAWAYTYGAAAEWYQGNWTLRGGLFVMSQTPAGGGGDSAEGFGLDPTFNNFEMVGEIEERHQLWGQPGKLKIHGFLIRGRMGTFADVIALSQATGLDVSGALAAVRHYKSRPGVSLNLEQ